MILIVTATPMEMKAAFGFAGAPSVSQGEFAEFEIGGHGVLLTVAGVGLVNTGIAMGRALGRSDVDGVVNLGIAGAYDVEEFPMTSTCYAWQETWPEYGLLEEDGSVDHKATGFPLGHVNDKPVWHRMKLNPVNDAEAMGLTLPETFLRASSMSVSGVTGGATRAGWLKIAYNADLENMEGFAAAYAAMQAGLPFLEVRTVSNLVGSRDSEDWDIKGALKALGTAAKGLFAGA
ncbi:futalosine hydrolase [uncultured Pseudodesulfovibrio sp.]|uniref:futalosine hydrolase n=1 Tax=uncultured Pseudodesulfovibrio sp. TaxID=2035858 RepID=UPI0029C779E2|nr:futalosine hydrolase [uncultured Pseudodesulfovibrio sp.]